MNAPKKISNHSKKGASEFESEDTQTRILTVAERLFAEQGFDGTSFRQIAAEARVNLAAAHYHFGNKEALYTAAVTRRLRPLNDIRLSLLATAEAGNKDKPVPLRQLLELFISPILEAARDPAHGGPSLLLLMSRIMSESKPFITALLVAELEPFMQRLYRAIRRNLPQLSPEEFTWRFHFMVGTVAQNLSQLHRIEILSHGLCRSNDDTAILRRLVDFTLAGLTAPLTSP
jgi:AcrR family transcriptional regulator